MDKIRKPMALVLAFAVLLACVAGCSKNTTAPAATPAPLETPAPSEQKTPEPPAPSEQPPAELTAETLTALDDMIPVYDSIIRTYIEHSPDRRDLRPNDEVFFWSVLFHLCTNYGGVFAEIETDAAQFKVPTAYMEALAKSCFADYTAIPELPPQTYPITFDDAWDAYFVTASDSGNTGTEVIGYEANADGTFDALVAFVEYTDEVPGGALLDSVYRFTLSELPADAAGAFRFSVLRADNTYTEIAQVKEINERDGGLFVVVDLLELVAPEAEGAPANGAQQDMVWEKVEEDIEFALYDAATFSFDRFDELFPDIKIANAMADSHRFFLAQADRLTEDGERPVFYMSSYNNMIFFGTFAAAYFFPA